ncbi:hypothetical protein [Methylorubrum populi]
MAVPAALGLPTPAECARLAGLHSERARRNRELAQDLRRDGANVPADLNERRARVDQRTADILTAYARELEARAVAGREIEAAE